MEAHGESPSRFLRISKENVSDAVLRSLGVRQRAGKLTERARHLLNKRLTETILAAVGGFIDATDADPEFAPAWVGLSDACSRLSLYGASWPADMFPKAKAAAHTALRFDPSLAEAHNALRGNRQARDFA